MIRSTASKVMWVGRATVFLVGLAVILALVFGVATTALGANGNPFLLGKSNVATALSKLTGNVNGAAMQVVNSNADANDTALSLGVQAGEAPMRVNSGVKVANLNADRIDNREASSFANGVGGVATNADKLDGKDSSGFLGKTEKAADSAHADQADSATSANNAGNANTLDNKDSTEFLGKTEKAADADKLDGVDSAAFWRGNSYTLSKTVSGTANGTTQANHTCNSGDRLLSGGYYVSGTGFEVFADAPLSSAYYLYWRSGATANNAVLYVTCADF